MFKAISMGARSQNAAVTKMSAFAWLSAKSVNEKYESQRPAKLNTGRKEYKAIMPIATRERLSSDMVQPRNDARSADLQLCAPKPSSRSEEAPRSTPAPNSTITKPIIARFQGHTTKSYRYPSGPRNNSADK